MIERIIAFSARNRFLTFALTVFLAVAGWTALQRTPLDAIPDLSDTQVILFTEWMGRSPDLVEDQITYPLVAQMLAAPGVQTVRGQSMFGMSFVSIIFDDDVDLYWARSRVLEYLSGIGPKLPPGVTPVLGPDATGVGWVYEYALRSVDGNTSLADLRSLQDWTLRFALESVPGVAQVASLGGHVKEYQIDVDPDRLRAYGVSLAQVGRAVAASNQDVGGRALEIADTEYVVRGRGYVTSVEDLELTPVGMRKPGVPVLLRDVARVQLGSALRRGAAELNGEGETAGGIVIMRAGENARDVIRRVQARLEEVKRSLPPGVEIVPAYNRAELIDRATDNLKTKLIEEMIVVSLIVALFLFHFRSALVVILTLPLAVLLSFIPMQQLGITANIMSLGGIAIAIGAMVDAAIILVENAHKRLEEWEEAGRPGSRNEVLIEAFQEVGRPLFFSLLVITVSFLPVFALEGQEGRLFSPLAYTKTFSMGFATLLAITFTPALALTLIRGRIRKEEDHPVSRLFTRIYEPAVRFVLERPRAVIAGAALLVLGTVPVFLSLESEFMPPLNEGSILYMPTAVPGMSLDEAVNVMQRQDAILKSFPEVETVFGKAGRAETPTDPAPISMFETVVTLKPEDQWRDGMTFDKLLAEMNREMRFAGMSNTFWMPIQTRTEMLATGVRSALALKVYGADVKDVEAAGIEVERILSEVPGTRSVFAERIGGGRYLDFDIDRRAAARYGVSVEEIGMAIETAIGGTTVSRTVEGRERYPISIRYARDFRSTPEALERTLVMTESGAQIPLAYVARLHFRDGPPMIGSENARLTSLVTLDVEPGIAISEYVERADAALREQLRLPAGVTLRWAGQHEHWARAKERLKLAVPATLFLIFLLLYLNSRSLTETWIVLLAVPFSLVGAFWLLWLLDYNLSIAVWVGLIALAGLDAETGIVMLVYLDQSFRRARDRGTLTSEAALREVIVHGAAKRIRPKAMTVLTVIFGLLPILWGTGTGSEVMKRIAAPMVGGVVTSAALELLVYPAIYLLWKRGQVRGRAAVLNS